MVSHGNVFVNPRAGRALKRPKSLNAEEVPRRISSSDDPLVSLIVKVFGAEGIGRPSTSNVSACDRLYRVILWVEPDEEKLTKTAEGLPDPQWDWAVEFQIRSSLLTEGSPLLHVEVVRLHNDLEPGTSSGIASVNRAQIRLPRTMSEIKKGRFGLVRNEGPGTIAEGHIGLSMQVRRASTG